MFNSITSHKELIHFLSQPNEYSRFIKEKIQRKQLEHVAYKTEIHHMIPYHAGGTDNKFNKIRLTCNEHLEAHKLLFQVYGLLADQYVINMRSKNNEKASYLRIKLSHEMSKQNKTGFNNICQQKDRGQKGGLVRSKAKDTSFEKKLSMECRNLLATNHCWVFKKTGYKVFIQANEFSLMRDLAKKLIVYVPCFEGLKNLSLQHIAGNLGKVVKKRRKSAYGWELNEIL
jgi:hypothetical protein